MKQQYGPWLCFQGSLKAQRPDAPTSSIHTDGAKSPSLASDGSADQTSQPVIPPVTPQDTPVLCDHSCYHFPPL